MNTNYFGNGILVSLRTVMDQQQLREIRKEIENGEYHRVVTRIRSKITDNLLRLQPVFLTQGRLQFENIVVFTYANIFVNGLIIYLFPFGNIQK